MTVAATHAADPLCIWLPYIRGGSGTDVYTRLLAQALTDAGHRVHVQGFAQPFQYVPGLLRSVPAPPGAQVTLANSWNGFAFRRRHIKLVTVMHHCVFDAGYLPHRSMSQAVFHEALVRLYERRSLAVSAAVVAVSQYTAVSLRESFGVQQTTVIPNGIDTNFYKPSRDGGLRRGDRPFRLLFVGNPSRRKGADLLAPIMERLGPDYVLDLAAGLRGRNEFRMTDNMRRLPRLSASALRDAYRNADALLFPSRLEGFGYAAAEAMACGTPVIATRASSLPEIVEDGISGILCQPNDVDCFANAVRRLSQNPDLLLALGAAARESAHDRFALATMASRYEDCFRTALEDPVKLLSKA